MVARTSLHFDDTAFRQFLNDQLPDDHREDLNAHLEVCSACQARLEELARGDTSWEDIRAGLKPADLETHDAEALDTTAESSADAFHRFAPSFLESTEAENSLGRFGRYEIEDVIGCGGMGVVLKGYDGALNRYSAIKVLAPTLATSAAARRRFSREAQSAAAVVHDHVVPIHTVDEEQNLPYFVMPLIDGQSLEQRVADRGPLTVQEVLRIGMQVASGLAAAHAQGLVHRDVKPGNIMLENGVDRVMITDFGLARAVDDAQVTQSGVIAGTPRYMSPEQARGEPLDHRSDLFSLGSVLYFMATGHSPFRAQTTMGVLRRILDEAPRPIRESSPEMPAWLDGLIAKLLAKDPDDRFQSAEEVRELLASWLAYLQSPTVVDKPQSPKPPVLKSGSPPRRRWIRNMVIAAGFAGAIALAGIVLIAKLGETTVRFEIDDPTLAVRFGANEITVDNDDQKIQIRPGKSNQFVVLQNGTEIVGSSFQLKRGDQVVLRVHSTNGEVKVESGPKIVIDPRLRNNQIAQQQRSPKAVNPNRPNQQQQQTAVDLYQRAAQDLGAQNQSYPYFHKEYLKQDPNSFYQADLLSYRASSSPSPTIATKPQKVIPTLATVTQLAFSPSGNRFATISGNALSLFDGRSGETQGFIRMPSGTIADLAFSVDGRLLATANDDGAVRLWDPANRTAVGKSIPGSKTRRLIFPSTNQILLSDRDAPLTFWSVPELKKLKTIHGPPTSVDQLVISQSRRLLATVQADETTVMGWSLDTGEQKWSVDHQSPVRGIQFAPNNISFVTGGDDGELRGWRATDGAALWRTRGDEKAKVTAVLWTPDSKAVIYGLSNGTIGLLNGRTGYVVQVLKAHEGRVTALAVSPAGNLLISCGNDEGALKIWKINPGFAIQQTAPGVYYGGQSRYENSNSGSSNFKAGTSYPTKQKDSRFDPALHSAYEYARDKASQPPMNQDAKATVNTQFLIDSLLAIRRYESAKQTADDQTLKQKIIRESATRYRDIAAKYRSHIAGLLAQVHEARCRQQLGEFQKAKALAEEVVKTSGNGPEWDAVRFHARGIVKSCEEALTNPKKANSTNPSKESPSPNSNPGAGR